MATQGGTSPSAEESGAIKCLSIAKQQGARIKRFKRHRLMSGFNSEPYRRWERKSPEQRLGL